jgi:hypothetical protein
MAARLHVYVSDGHCCCRAHFSTSTQGRQWAATSSFVPNYIIEPQLTNALTW